MQTSGLVHHVEILCEDINDCLQKWTDQFGFVLFAKRKRKTLTQFALRAGKSVILLTTSNDHDDSEFITSSGNANPCHTAARAHTCSAHGECQTGIPSGHEFTVDIKRGVNTNHYSRNTVVNVAFETHDVATSIEKFKTPISANESRENILISPRRQIQDEYGSVVYSVVKSCVGNVIHTLINTENYRGVFLPGFMPVQLPGQRNALRHDFTFDHVTFVVGLGRSQPVIDWYEKHFGMKRFIINSEETDENGFVIRSGDVGLRLKAMQYWKCAQTGLWSAPNNPAALKFVIAESLYGTGIDQIQTFLRGHGGEGIQHIGLHTDDIRQAVSSLKTRGVDFIQPPHQYYTDETKAQEIALVGESCAELARLGVLLDSEALGEDSDFHKDETKRYLLQVFTKPLFRNEDTFFMEFIQRCGASGFGQGNISALWRAVQSYMKSQANNCK